MAAAYVPSPAAALTFVGSKVGTAVVKAVCTSAVAGRLTPEVLGEALVSSSSVRSHVQAELLQFVAVRVAVSSPKRMTWLITLLTEFLAKGGGGSTDAVKLLGSKAVRYHITSFGVRGTVASALAALAVQAGMATCQLLSSNVKPKLSPQALRSRLQHAKNHRRRQQALERAQAEGRDEEALAAMKHQFEKEEAAERGQEWAEEPEGMSMAQYRYTLTTAVLGGAGTVVGSGVGAALGTAVLPGFGTVIGSILFSFSGGYLPSYVRDKKGPDDVRARQARELRAFAPLHMRERDADFIEMSPLPERGAAAPTLAVQDLVEEPSEREDSVVVFSRRTTPTEGVPMSSPLSASVGGAADKAPAPAVASTLYSLVKWVAPLVGSSRETDVTVAPTIATASSSRSSSQSNWVDLGVDTEEEAPGQGPPPEDVVATSGAATPADMLTVLGGKMEVLPAGLGWDDVDRHVDSFGEEELVLVFYVDEPVPQNTTGNASP